MKDLSTLIRETAAPANWRIKVESAAAGLGNWEQADIDVAWYAVGTVLESISVLAFELRHQEDDLAASLAQWVSRERARLHERRELISDEAEPAFDRIVMTVLGDIVDRLDEVARNYEALSVSRSTFAKLSPPVLSDKQKAIADEVAEHLRRAAVQVRGLQVSTRNSNLEWEIYLNLIEGASRHFEDMARGEAVQVDLAA